MKQRLRYVGLRPFRLVLNNVRYDLHRGDVVELDLKSLSGKRMRCFVNLTEKRAEAERRSREIKRHIRKAGQVK